MIKNQVVKIFLLFFVLWAGPSHADDCSEDALSKHVENYNSQCLLNPSKTFLVSYTCRPEDYTNEATGVIYKKGHFRYTGYVNCQGERHGKGVYEGLNNNAEANYVGEFHEDNRTGWGKEIYSGSFAAPKTWITGYFLNGFEAGSISGRICDDIFFGGCGQVFKSYKIFETSEKTKLDVWGPLEAKLDGPMMFLEDNGKIYKGVWFKDDECGFEPTCEINNTEIDPNFPTLER